MFRYHRRFSSFGTYFLHQEDFFLEIFWLHEITFHEIFHLAFPFSLPLPFSLALLLISTSISFTTFLGRPNSLEEMGMGGGVHPHHDVGVDCFQCIITPPHKLVVCGKKGLKNAKKTQNRLKQSKKNSWPNFCELAKIWHLCSARGPWKKIFISKHTSFF